MKNKYEEVYKASFETDRLLFFAEQNAPSYQKEYWQELEEINDQAYFVMLFAQFENFIDGLIMEVDPDAVREPFMKKICALNIGKSNQYHKSVEKLYETRCNIAHGHYSKTGRIFIKDVYLSLKGIAEHVEHHLFTPFFDSEDSI
jgi:hypothetical protein